MELIQDEILREFAAESLAGLEAAAGDLRALGGDGGDDDAALRLLTTLHGMKGTAACLELAGVASLAHAAEDLLVGCRARREVPGAARLALGEAVAALAEDLRHLGVCGPSGLQEHGELEERLRTLASGGSPSPAEGGARGGPAASVPQGTEAPQGGRRDGEPPVPVSRAWRRAVRVVPCLAASLGKRVHVLEDGGGLHVDGLVVAELRGPLEHAARNAVDHGIETPEMRVAAGKPSAGVLVLRARVRDRHLVLSLEEDGRGVDEDQVRRLAVEEGVLDAEEAAQLRGEPLLELLFRPGFSTRGQATLVSGRGIGLNAVKAAACRLGGEARFRSTAGAGTDLEMVLPLEWAVLEVLLTSAGGRFLAVPRHAVRGRVAGAAAQVARRHGRLHLRWRGELVPLLEGAFLPGVTPGARPEGGTVLLLAEAGATFGLPVERVSMPCRGPLRLRDGVSQEPAAPWLVSPGSGADVPLLDLRHLLESAGRL